jgi:hypothetical protein
MSIRLLDPSLKSLLRELNLGHSMVRFTMERHFLKALIDVYLDGGGSDETGAFRWSKFDVQLRSVGKPPSSVYERIPPAVGLDANDLGVDVHLTFAVDLAVKLSPPIFLDSHIYLPDSLVAVSVDIEDVGVKALSLTALLQVSLVNVKAASPGYVAWWLQPDNSNPQDRALSFKVELVDVAPFHASLLERFLLAYCQHLHLMPLSQ